MAAADKAFQAEIDAFNKIQQRVRGVAVSFQAPAGADAGFPDFGFTFTLPNGKNIDLHVEYKASHTAQMGSMRDWRFNGSKFYTPDTGSNQKAELIELMNNTPVAITNAKRLLNDLKAYFSPNVTELSSSSLSVVPDKVTRRQYTDNFVAKTKNYVVANISSPSLGSKIITHYKNKFKKSIRSRATGSILAMMIDKEIWFMDTSGSVTTQDKEFISKALGAPSTIKPLSSLTAKLECRIQPRGLSAPVNNPKPTSIDVMASYRLQSKPTSGTKII